MPAQHYQQQEMQQRASLLSSLAANGTDADPHNVSSIPPWVHVNDGDDGGPPLLPPQEDVRPNTRHYKPPPSHYKPGRKWDYLRTAEPALLSSPIAEHQSRWKPFMSSGPNPQEVDQGARVVSQAWMDENMPFLSRGWDPADDAAADGDLAKGRGGLMYRGKWLVSPERQERTVRFFWRLLLKNPFVPAVFRVIVLAFSAAALGIACQIYLAVKRANSHADLTSGCATRASTYMAIAVGSVAIPYVLGITWDEYMSKPLGLRSAWAKVLLLLCDLFFIVFSASNLSLAFDALFDHRWACYRVEYEANNDPNANVPSTCPNNPGICYQQRALSSVLFISLMAWMITFSISVLRVVEKLRPD